MLELWFAIQFELYDSIKTGIEVLKQTFHLPTMKYFKKHIEKNIFSYFLSNQRLIKCKEFQEQWQVCTVSKIKALKSSFMSIDIIFKVK